MPHQRVRAAVAVVGVAALGAFLMSGNAAAAGGKRAVVPDVKPAWATSARATGTAPTSQSVSIRVGLKMRDQAGAEGLVRDLSDPSSPRYGHYLTPKAFTTRFAPTAASVDRVSSYLQSQGLKVTGVAQGNQWVNASGTVAQLNKAFATTSEDVLLPAARRSAHRRAPSPCRPRSRPTCRRSPACRSARRT